MLSERRKQQLAALETLARSRGFSLRHSNGAVVALCHGPWSAENARFVGGYQKIKSLLEMLPPSRISVDGYSLP